MFYSNIDPVAFSIGQFSVRWYGIMHLIAFIGVFWYFIQHRYASPTARPWTVENIADLLFYAAIGVIFGGTFGYWLLYEPSRILSDPFILIKFWLPGRAFHGGLIGVLIALGIYCRTQQRRFLEVTDFIAPAVPIGLAFGRLGNFLNGELWGRATTLPWGMVFSNAGPESRHPSQLYEFLLEGVLLFLILYLYSRKKRPEGATTGMFVLWYGVFRFLVEFVREPDQNKGFIAGDWLTMGQALSIPMVVIGLLLFCHAHYKQKNLPMKKNPLRIH